MRTRYYDARGGRLVYLSQRASPDFWDSQWSASARKHLYDRLPRRSLVVNQTQRCVGRGELVLEGGCGLAQNAWHLHRSGYRTIALDNVPRTLSEVQRRVPQVRPVRGDVRALPLPDVSIDAYWSIGVIEHWYSGFDEAMSEMARVLKVGGHLFLTFPYMNRLRKLKARLGSYPLWEPDRDQLDAFYQFALDHRVVTRQFEGAGFQLVAKKPFLAVTGLEEEMPRRPARWLQRTRGSRHLAKAFRTFVAIALRPWTSHCILLVLRKGQDSAAAVRRGS